MSGYTSQNLFITGRAFNITPRGAVGAEFDPQQVGDICATAVPLLSEYRMDGMDGLLHPAFSNTTIVVSTQEDIPFDTAPPQTPYLRTNRFPRHRDLLNEDVGEIPRMTSKADIVWRTQAVLDVRISVWNKPAAGAVLKAALDNLGLVDPRDLEIGGRFDQLLATELGVLNHSFPQVIRLKRGADRPDEETRPLPGIR